MRLDARDVHGHVHHRGAALAQGLRDWGWVTAEYAMLPRATAERTDRESVRGKIGGRTYEISRLIGRCLRGVVDMKALGENQIQLDCDVLQADGGTRTASITGAYVALVDALRWAERNRKIKRADKVLKDCVSAVSVGVINGTPMLDLPYIEDSQAMTDMNVGHDRIGAVHRDPGHGRASSVQPRRAEPVAGSGRKGQQGASGRPACGAGRMMRFALPRGSE